MPGYTLGLEKEKQRAQESYLFLHQTTQQLFIWCTGKTKQNKTQTQTKLDQIFEDQTAT